MTANNTHTRKAKGRKLCQEVKAAIHKFFPLLQNDDIRVTSSGAGGEDIVLSPAARELLPISTECKATEKFNLREAWDQAESNSKQWNAVVVHRKNHTNPVAVVALDYFIELHSDCHKLATENLKLNEYIKQFKPKDTV